MNRQTSFSDLEMQAGRPRATRRARFPSEPDEACPWKEWEALVAGARKADAERRGVRPGMGRPRVDDSTMPRMYVVQTCFGLSGLACEEQVWGSAAMRRFVGVVPGGAPDATTLCRFRHLPEESGTAAGTLDAVAEPAAGRGLQMAAAPSWMPPSWRAHPPPRAPQGSAVPAHQAKRGQNRHFGHKFGIGADAEGGVPHGAHPDAANVHDLGRLPDLVGEGDEGVWADAGHVGAEGRAASGPRLAGISWHVAKRRSALSGEDLPPESAKSAVRRAVEHAFHIPKDTFGTRRTRLGGLAKDPGFLAAAVAAAGALVARRGPGRSARLPPSRPRTRRRSSKGSGRGRGGRRRGRQAGQRQHPHRASSGRGGVAVPTACMPAPGAAWRAGPSKIANPEILRAGLAT